MSRAGRDALAREAALGAALERLLAAVPYNRFLGVRAERLGDELTARMPFAERLVGNPLLPALHGGAIGAFLEIAAIMQLAWDRAEAALDAGGPAAEAIREGRFPPLPKTIDVTVDFLRSGRPRETFARARVQKSGRRIAHVHVEAWQEERTRPVAMLRGNFLSPDEA